MSYRLWIRMVTALAGVICLSSPATVLAAGDVNSSHCPNEASSGFRSYLPDCRAYEMSTPAFKEGVAVGANFVSQDGSRLLGNGRAAFAGAENAEHGGWYTFEHEFASNEWLTKALSPPAQAFPHSTFLGAGATLERSLWAAVTSPLVGVDETLYYQLNPGGALEAVGPIHPQPAVPHATPFSPFRLAGASNDLTHVLLNIENPRSEEVEEGYARSWPGDTTVPATASLYEYNGIGNAEPTLVGVANQERLNGSPINGKAVLLSQCGTTLGVAEAGGPNDAYNAVSATGETVFFTVQPGPCTASGGVKGSGPKATELYARLNGARTLAISEPALTPERESDCSGTCKDYETEKNGRERLAGYFAGASADGSKVFFTTEQPLVNEDEDGTNDLYMDEMGCPAPATACLIEEEQVRHVVEVSHDPNAGEAAEVQGVVRVSEDGSHVYFVARGVLTQGKNVEGREPVPSAYNLYVYGPDPAHLGTYHTVFVATLLTGAEEVNLEEEQITELDALRTSASETCVLRKEATGSCEFRVLGEHFGTLGTGGTLQADKSVWALEDRRPAQATPDGRFLLFLSSAKLTADDTSKAAQLFLYDAQTERIARVSRGYRGHSEDGNTAVAADAPKIPAQQYQAASDPTSAGSGLSVTTNGSTVFFESRDSLTLQAVMGVNNVYEYKEGNVYLVSDGQDGTVRIGEPGVKLVGTDGSGEDVFFTTSDRLAPEDTDTQVDVYDARIDGASLGPAPAAACEGESCQGPLSAPPLLSTLGSSATQAGGGNVTLPVSGLAAKPKAKRLTRAQELAGALRACKTKRKKERAACKARARKRYGTKSNAKKSDRKGN